MYGNTKGQEHAEASYRIELIESTLNGWEAEHCYYCDHDSA
jgi:hypothetical protein